MKKIILIVLAIMLFCAPAFSDDNGEEKGGVGLRIDGGAGLAGSIFTTFFTVNPEIMYDFGLVAIGGGVNTMFGLTFSDIYMAPYAEVELAWFYLAGGALFELKPAEENAKAPDGFITSTTENNISPYVVLGADFPLLPIGPGKLGLDISMGIIPTAAPVVVVDDSGSFVGNLIGTILISSLSAFFNIVKGGVSVYYTATF